MTIGEHDSTFEGRPIEEFSSDAGVQNVEAAIRLAVAYDAWEDGTKVPDLIAQLCEDPKAPQVKALVIGPWGYDGDDPADPIYAKLAEPEVAETLSGLKALFVGDITYEEQEISWIVQGDVAPVLAAYPQLEVLRVRGGNGLALNGLESSSLKKLIVEAGGLRREIIEQVCNSKLPNLEHLELWLGSENYDANHTVDDLMPLLSGRLFPKLRYLGLRDCEYTDDVARAAADAPVLSQLDTLDLSMGTFGDDGARALIASPQTKKLKTLDVSHHYMSPAVAAELAAIGPKLIADEGQDPGAERYIQVSE
jgi:hypothetical protein